MPLGREVDLGPGDIVLDGDPAPPKGYSPHFSAHVRCGQAAGLMKMPLGTEATWPHCVRWGPSFLSAKGGEQ